MGEHVSKREERRELLQNTIEDLVTKLLWDDRKEDEELPRGDIELMLSMGDVTIDEMIEWFATPLRMHLKEKKS